MPGNSEKYNIVIAVKSGRLVKVTKELLKVAAGFAQIRGAAEAAMESFSRFEKQKVKTSVQIPATIQSLGTDDAGIANISQIIDFLDTQSGQGKTFKKRTKMGSMFGDEVKTPEEARIARLLARPRGSNTGRGNYNITASPSQAVSFPPGASSPTVVNDTGIQQQLDLIHSRKSASNRISNAAENAREYHEAGIAIRDVVFGLENVKASKEDIALVVAEMEKLANASNKAEMEVDQLSKEMIEVRTSIMGGGVPIPGSISPATAIQTQAQVETKPKRKRRRKKTEPVAAEQALEKTEEKANDKRVMDAKETAKEIINVEELLYTQLVALSVKNAKKRARAEVRARDDFNKKSKKAQTSAVIKQGNIAARRELKLLRAQDFSKFTGRIQIDDETIINFNREMLRAVKNTSGLGNEIREVLMLLDIMQAEGKQSFELVQAKDIAHFEGIDNIESTALQLDELRRSRIDAELNIPKALEKTAPANEIKRLAKQVKPHEIFEDVPQAAKEAEDSIDEVSEALKSYNRTQDEYVDKVEESLEGIRKNNKENEKLRKSTNQLNKEQNKNKRVQEGLAKGNLASGKAFSRQAQGLGGLVRIYATVAANVFALTSAFQALKTVVDFRILEDNASDFAISTGVSLKRLAKDIKAVTGGQLDRRQALELANLGLSGGATQEQLLEITEIATKAAQALGRNVPEAVNRLVQAIIKGEPELVDEFGIILRVERATEEYARAINKVSSELTIWERQQAVINQVSTQAAQKFGDVNIRVNEFVRLSQETAEALRDFFLPIINYIEPLARTFADNVHLIISSLAILGTSTFGFLTPKILSFGDAIKDVINNQAIKQNNRYAESIIATTASFTASSKNVQKTFGDAARRGGKKGGTDLLSLFLLGRTDAGKFSPKLFKDKKLLDSILEGATLESKEFKKRFKKILPKDLFRELNDAIIEKISENRSDKKADLAGTILFGGRQLDLRDAIVLRNTRKAIGGVGDIVGRESQKELLKIQKRSKGIFGVFDRFNQRLGLATSKLASTIFQSYSSVFDNSRGLVEGFTFSIKEANRTLKSKNILVTLLNTSLIFLNVTLATTIRFVGTLIKTLGIPVAIITALYFITKKLAVATGIWSTNIKEANTILEEVRKNIVPLNDSAERLKELSTALNEGSGSFDNLNEQVKTFSNLSNEAIKNIEKIKKSVNLKQEIGNFELFIRRIGIGIAETSRDIGKFIVEDISMAAEAINRIFENINIDFRFNIDRRKYFKSAEIFANDVNAYIETILLTNVRPEQLNSFFDNIIGDDNSLKRLKGLRVESQAFREILETAFIEGDNLFLNNLEEAFRRNGESAQLAAKQLSNYKSALDSLNKTVLDDFGKFNQRNPYGKLLRSIAPVFSTLEDIENTTNEFLEADFKKVRDAFSDLDSGTKRFLGLDDTLSTTENIERFKEETARIRENFSIAELSAKRLISLNLDKEVASKAVNLVERQKSTFPDPALFNNLIKRLKEQEKIEREILSNRNSLIEATIDLKNKELELTDPDDLQQKQTTETEIEQLKADQLALTNSLIEAEQKLLELAQSSGEKIRSSFSQDIGLDSNNIFSGKLTSLKETEGLLNAISTNAPEKLTEAIGKVIDNLDPYTRNIIGLNKELFSSAENLEKLSKFTAGISSLFKDYQKTIEDTIKLNEKLELAGERVDLDIEGSLTRQAKIQKEINKERVKQINAQITILSVGISNLKTEEQKSAVSTKLLELEKERAKLNRENVIIEENAALEEQIKNLDLLLKKVANLQSIEEIRLGMLETLSETGRAEDRANVTKAQRKHIEAINKSRLDQNMLEQASIMQQIEQLKLRKDNLGAQEQSRRIAEKQLDLDKKQAEADKIRLDNLLAIRKQILAEDEATNRTISSRFDARLVKLVTNELILAVEKFEQSMVTATEFYVTSILGTTDKFFDEWIRGLAEVNTNVLEVLKTAAESAFNVFKDASLSFLIDQVKLAFRKFIAGTVLKKFITPTELQSIDEQIKDLRENALKDKVADPIVDELKDLKQEFKNCFNKNNNNTGTILPAAFYTASSNNSGVVYDSPHTEYIMKVADSNRNTRIPPSNSDPTSTNRNTRTGYPYETKPGRGPTPPVNELSYEQMSALQDRQVTDDYNALELAIIRDNNALNIMQNSDEPWIGTERFNKPNLMHLMKFPSHDSVETSIRTPFALLTGKGYRGAGLDTIEEIVPKFAPKEENDVEKYIADLEEISGIDRKTKITDDNIVALVSAMIEKEQAAGLQYPPELLQRVFDNFLLEKDLFSKIKKEGITLSDAEQSDIVKLLQTGDIDRSPDKLIEELKSNLGENSTLINKLDMYSRKIEEKAQKQVEVVDKSTKALPEVVDKSTMETVNSINRVNDTLKNVNDSIINGFNGLKGLITRPPNEQSPGASIPQDTGGFIQASFNSSSTGMAEVSTRSGIPIAADQRRKQTIDKPIFDTSKNTEVTGKNTGLLSLMPEQLKTTYGILAAGQITNQLLRAMGASNKASGIVGILLSAAQIAVSAYAGGGAGGSPSTGGSTGGGTSFPKTIALAKGGIVKRPTLSTFAENGPEAAVPLPDGKTIPVTFMGGGQTKQGNTNIQIHVNMEKGTTNTSVSGTSDDKDERGRAINIGEAISTAVKAEIVEQQRPGGLLYGRA